MMPEHKLEGCVKSSTIEDDVARQVLLLFLCLLSNCEPPEGRMVLIIKASEHFYVWHKGQVQ